MYFPEGNQQSLSGVGFLENKSLSGNVVEMSSVSNRVTYVIIELIEKCKMFKKMGSEKFQSNLENRFDAIKTTIDVNQNLEM